MVFSKPDIDIQQCKEIIFGLLQNKSIAELSDCMKPPKKDIYCTIQKLQRKYDSPQDIEVVVSKFLKGDFIARYWRDMSWLK